MDNKIYFSIPDFYFNFNLNIALLDLIEKEKYKFYNDIIIDSVYGSFPCIWNGGRYINGTTSFDNILNTIKPFNDRGVSIRYTFTNSLITEQHLNDTLGNTILKLSENPLNGVNCSSQLMMDYIQKNYPQYYTMWSTTLGEKDINKINELSQNNLLVLDYTFNNDFKSLKKFKYKNNLELLCCETCQDNCPQRQNHYLNQNKQQMYLTNEPFHCIAPLANLHDTTFKRKHYISIEDIRNKYIPLGYNKFKINGRNRSIFDTLENYIIYFVKPQYQNEIRRQLLEIII